MASPEEPLSGMTLNEWDEDRVNEWLSSKGYSQYHQQILENGISGDMLSLLDHESLREVGVHSVGHRLHILREVYQLKVAQGIPIEPEHYVPPSEATENSRQDGVTLDRLHQLVQELGERTKLLEQENRRLAENLSLLIDNMPPSKSQDQDAEATLKHQPSFNVLNGNNMPHTPGVKHHRLTDATMVESPQTSPARPEHDVSSSNYLSKSLHKPPSTPQADSVRTPLHRSHSHSYLNQTQPSTPGPYNSKLPKEAPPSSASSSVDNQLKSFKVSIEDPCWKVLPAALKKYKINDDWRKYVMFICHGSTERCLSYDEKPLLLFQRLKESNKNPVFMLRHIKDIRSPIAVAQQKQTQRQLTPTTASSRGTGTTPPVNGASTSNSAYSRNTRLHQPAILHPISAQAQANTAAAADYQEEPSPHPNISESLASARSMPTSYAIAIYPYTAEQDDEFDVAVDDTFIIRSREKGWWIVQRDVAGTGIPSTALEDAPKWIPAGCLLETSIPPSQAMQETRSITGLTSPPTNAPEGVKKPILPGHIISTSFPGITLMGYGDKGDHELTLVRGDIVRVFKRYNHWSYAIKQETGERGWVPSWYVGKYSEKSATPPVLVPPTPTSGSISASPSATSAASSSLPTLTPATSLSATSGLPQSAILTPSGDPSEGMAFPAVNGLAAVMGAGVVNGSPMSQAFPTSNSTTVGVGVGGYGRNPMPLI
ncbi:hypothetical protein DL93DRAFT_2165780 [Clavulina sp. PMI_390]|nr:hypothetical protein DL93DRAFT_2165780 [Clavulina sp. PMI_390]